MNLKNLTHRRFGLVICVAGAALAFAAPAQADNYTALGDSYASGTGSGGTVLNSSCDRRTSAYPYLVSQARANTSLNFAACTGATTTDLLNRQISSVTSSTNLVTVQIGGNDIGFANLIIGCTFGACDSQLTNAQTSIRNTLPAKINSVYSAIKVRAPQAHVVVVGYPSPTGTRTCFGALGISSSEVTGINAVATVLRDTIKSNAQAAGFDFADAIGPFSGHDVCSSAPWLNGFTFGTTSYHPNAAGHRSGLLPLVRSFVG